MVLQHGPLLLVSMFKGVCPPQPSDLPPRTQRLCSQSAHFWTPEKAGVMEPLLTSSPVIGKRVWDTGMESAILSKC